MYAFLVFIALAASSTSASDVWHKRAYPSGSPAPSAYPSKTAWTSQAPSIPAAYSTSAYGTPSRSAKSWGSVPPSAAVPSGQPSGEPPMGSSPSAAAAAAPPPPPSSATIAWPSSASALATSRPNRLSNFDQVGSSAWGSLSAPTFPKWIDTPHGKPYRHAPWGNCTTTSCYPSIQSQIPVTNVTRHYDFSVSRGAISPDGVKRNVILINGQYPGPLIHANWGDWIEVTVHNNIYEPEEGTSIHWHGALQLGTQWMDGVPSVSQCPIAPGASYTYLFRAEQFGSSWYHAHYSAQYTGGVMGPMQIYGPSQLDYDIDLGPVMVSDWNHIPYFQMVDNIMTLDLEKHPPTSDSGLINGRGRFDCSKASYGNNRTNWLATDVPSKLKWSCVPGVERAKFKFQSGKVHRLRLMNTGSMGIHKFSIDGHQMRVIATDYVPIVPYTTNVVTLAVGQRTDVLITADGNPRSAYWMRSEILYDATCGGLAPPGTDNIPTLAAVYYEHADTSIEPTTTSSNNLASCNNDPLEMTHPQYALAPSTTAFYQNLLLDLTQNSTGSWEWQINGVTYRGDYNTPLLYEAADGVYDFSANPEWQIYNFGSNTSVILNITNATPFPHPIHMHGHNFYVLSVGGYGSVWNGSVTNPSNPMRRDTQIMPALGYVAIQFEADNPGVWPLHCHAAWHLSGGWYINIMSQPDQIQGIPPGQREATCEPWSRYSTQHVVDQIDSGT